MEPSTPTSLESSPTSSTLTTSGISLTTLDNILFQLAMTGDDKIAEPIASILPFLLTHLGDISVIPALRSKSTEIFAHINKRLSLLALDPVLRSTLRFPLIPLLSVFLSIPPTSGADMRTSLTVFYLEKALEHYAGVSQLWSPSISTASAAGMAASAAAAAASSSSAVATYTTLSALGPEDKARFRECAQVTLFLLHDVHKRAIGVQNTLLHLFLRFLPGFADGPHLDVDSLLLLADGVAFRRALVDERKRIQTEALQGIDGMSTTQDQDHNAFREAILSPYGSSGSSDSSITSNLTTSPTSVATLAKSKTLAPRVDPYFASLLSSLELEVVTDAVPRYTRSQSLHRRTLSSSSSLGAAYATEVIRAAGINVTDRKECDKFVETLPLLSQLAFYNSHDLEVMGGSPKNTQNAENTESHIFLCPLVEDFLRKRRWGLIPANFLTEEQFASMAGATTTNLNSPSSPAEFVQDRVKNQEAILHALRCLFLYNPLVSLLHTGTLGTTTSSTNTTGTGASAVSPRSLRTTTGTTASVGSTTAGPSHRTVSFIRYCCLQVLSEADFVFISRNLRGVSGASLGLGQTNPDIPEQGWLSTPSELYGLQLAGVEFLLRGTAVSAISVVSGAALLTPTEFSLKYPTWGKFEEGIRSLPGKNTLEKTTASSSDYDEDGEEDGDGDTENGQNNSANRNNEISREVTRADTPSAPLQPFTVSEIPAHQWTYFRISETVPLLVIAAACCNHRESLPTRANDWLKKLSLTVVDTPWIVDELNSLALIEGAVKPTYILDTDVDSGMSTANTTTSNTTSTLVGVSSSLISVRARALLLLSHLPGACRDWRRTCRVLMGSLLWPCGTPGLSAAALTFISTIINFRDVGSSTVVSTTSTGSSATSPTALAIAASPARRAVCTACVPLLLRFVTATRRRIFLYAQLHQRERRRVVLAQSVTQSAGTQTTSRSIVVSVQREAALLGSALLALGSLASIVPAAVAKDLTVFDALLAHVRISFAVLAMEFQDGHRMGEEGYIGDDYSFEGVEDGGGIGIGMGGNSGSSTDPLASLTSISLSSMFAGSGSGSGSGLGSGSGASRNTLMTSNNTSGSNSVRSGGILASQGAHSVFANLHQQAVDALSHLRSAFLPFSAAFHPLSSPISSSVAFTPSPLVLRSLRRRLLSDLFLLPYGASADHADQTDSSTLATRLETALPSRRRERLVALQYLNRIFPPSDVALRLVNAVLLADDSAWSSGADIQEEARSGLNPLSPCFTPSLKAAVRTRGKGDGTLASSLARDTLLPLPALLAHLRRVISAGPEGDEGEPEALLRFSSPVSAGTAQMVALTPYLLRELDKDGDMGDKSEEGDNNPSNNSVSSRLPVASLDLRTLAALLQMLLQSIVSETLVYPSTTTTSSEVENVTEMSDVERMTEIIDDEPVCGPVLTLRRYLYSRNSHNGDEKNKAISYSPEVLYLRDFILQTLILLTYKYTSSAPSSTSAAVTPSPNSKSTPIPASGSTAFLQGLSAAGNVSGSLFSLIPAFTALSASSSAAGGGAMVTGSGAVIGAPGSVSAGSASASGSSVNLHNLYRQCLELCLTLLQWVLQASPPLILSSSPSSLSSTTTDATDAMTPTSFVEDLFLARCVPCLFFSPMRSLRLTSSRLFQRILRAIPSSQTSALVQLWMQYARNFLVSALEPYLASQIMAVAGVDKARQMGRFNTSGEANESHLEPQSPLGLIFHDWVHSNEEIYGDGEGNSGSGDGQVEPNMRGQGPRSEQEAENVENEVQRGVDGVTTSPSHTLDVPLSSTSTSTASTLEHIRATRDAKMAARRAKALGIDSGSVSTPSTTTSSASPLGKDLHSIHGSLLLCSMIAVELVRRGVRHAHGDERAPLSSFFSWDEFLSTSVNIAIDGHTDTETCALRGIFGIYALTCSLCAFFISPLFQIKKKNVTTSTSTSSIPTGMPPLSVHPELLRCAVLGLAHLSQSLPLAFLHENGSVVTMMAENSYGNATDLTKSGMTKETRTRPPSTPLINGQIQWNLGLGQPRKRHHELTSVASTALPSGSVSTSTATSATSSVSTSSSTAAAVATTAPPVSLFTPSPSSVLTWLFAIVKATHTPSTSSSSLSLSSSSSSSTPTLLPEACELGRAASLAMGLACCGSRSPSFLSAAQRHLSKLSLLPTTELHTSVGLSFGMLLSGVPFHAVELMVKGTSKQNIPAVMNDKKIGTLSKTFTPDSVLLNVSDESSADIILRCRLAIAFVEELCAQGSSPVADTTASESTTSLASTSTPDRNTSGTGLGMGLGLGDSENGVVSGRSLLQTGIFSLFPFLPLTPLSFAPVQIDVVRLETLLTVFQGTVATGSLAARSSALSWLLLIISHLSSVITTVLRSSELNGTSDVLPALDILKSHSTTLQKVLLGVLGSASASVSSSSSPSSSGSISTSSASGTSLVTSTSPTHSLDASALLLYALFMLNGLPSSVVGSPISPTSPASPRTDSLTLTPARQALLDNLQSTLRLSSSTSSSAGSISSPTSSYSSSSSVDLSTYRELLSIGLELGKPSLIYAFFLLSARESALLRTSPLAELCPSFFSSSAIDETIDTNSLLYREGAETQKSGVSHIFPLLPRLLRYQFDSNEKIAYVMRVLLLLLLRQMQKEYMKMKSTIPSLPTSSSTSSSTSGLLSGFQLYNAVLSALSSVLTLSASPTAPIHPLYAQFFAQYATSLMSRSVKVRLSTCLALFNIIQLALTPTAASISSSSSSLDSSALRPGAIPPSVLSMETALDLFTKSTALLDDISEEVRSAAGSLSKVLRDVLARLCDPVYASASSSSAAEDDLEKVLAFLLERDRGIVNPVPAVRRVSTELLLQVLTANTSRSQVGSSTETTSMSTSETPSGSTNTAVPTAGSVVVSPALKRHLPYIISRLIDNLSSLEPAELQYLQHHISSAMEGDAGAGTEAAAGLFPGMSGGNTGSIDQLRVSLTSSSRVFRALQLALGLVQADTLTAVLTSLCQTLISGTSLQTLHGALSSLLALLDPATVAARGEAYRTAAIAASAGVAKALESQASASRSVVDNPVFSSLSRAYGAVFRLARSKRRVKMAHFILRMAEVPVPFSTSPTSPASMVFEGDVRSNTSTASELASLPGASSSHLSIIERSFAAATLALSCAQSIAGQPQGKTSSSSTSSASREGAEALELLLPAAFLLMHLDPSVVRDSSATAAPPLAARALPLLREEGRVRPQHTAAILRRDGVNSRPSAQRLIFPAIPSTVSTTASTSVHEQYRTTPLPQGVLGDVETEQGEDVVAKDWTYAMLVSLTPEIYALDSSPTTGTFLSPLSPYFDEVVSNTTNANVSASRMLPLLPFTEDNRKCLSAEFDSLHVALLPITTSSPSPFGLGPWYNGYLKGTAPLPGSPPGSESILLTRASSLWHQMWVENVPGFRSGCFIYSSEILSTLLYLTAVPSSSTSSVMSVVLKPFSVPASSVPLPYRLRSLALSALETFALGLAAEAGDGSSAPPLASIAAALASVVGILRSRSFLGRTAVFPATVTLALGAKIALFRARGSVLRRREATQIAVLLRHLHRELVGMVESELDKVCKTSRLSPAVASLITGDILRDGEGSGEGVCSAMALSQITALFPILGQEMEMEMKDASTTISPVSHASTSLSYSHVPSPSPSPRATSTPVSLPLSFASLPSSRGIMVNFIRSLHNADTVERDVAHYARQYSRGEIGSERSPSASTPVTGTKSQLQEGMDGGLNTAAFESGVEKFLSICTQLGLTSEDITPDFEHAFSITAPATSTTSTTSATLTLAPFGLFTPHFFSSVRKALGPHDSATDSPETTSASTSSTATSALSVGASLFSVGEARVVGEKTSASSHESSMEGERRQSLKRKSVFAQVSAHALRRVLPKLPQNTSLSFIEKERHRDTRNATILWTVFYLLYALRQGYLWWTQVAILESLGSVMVMLSQEYSHDVDFVLPCGLVGGAIRFVAQFVQRSRHSSIRTAASQALCALLQYAVQAQSRTKNVHGQEQRRNHHVTAVTVKDLEKNVFGEMQGGKYMLMATETQPDVDLLLSYALRLLQEMKTNI